MTLTAEEAAWMRRIGTEAERRTAWGRCIALDHCPLQPEFRVLLVVWLDMPTVGLRPHDTRVIYFTTPHRVCEMHAGSVAATLTPDDVAREAEQEMVVEFARAECGWPASAEPTLSVSARKA